VDAQGQITLDRQPVTATEFKARLAELKQENPDLGVVVKGADDTDYQSMVAVLDTLRQLEITKMGMATE
jgi:biopolymer transport protein ExbD